MVLVALWFVLIYCVHRWLRDKSQYEQPNPIPQRSDTTNQDCEVRVGDGENLSTLLRLACVGDSMVYIFGISIFTDHQPQLLSDKQIYVLNLAHVLAVRV